MSLGQTRHVREEETCLYWNIEVNDDSHRSYEIKVCYIWRKIGLQFFKNVKRQTNNGAFTVTEGLSNEWVRFADEIDGRPTLSTIQTPHQTNHSSCLLSKTWSMVYSKTRDTLNAESDRRSTIPLVFTRIEYEWTPNPRNSYRHKKFSSGNCMQKEMRMKKEEMKKCKRVFSLDSEWVWEDQSNPSSEGKSQREMKFCDSSYKSGSECE